MSNPNNTVILLGRLVDNPKFICNRAGVEFASRFTLAVNRSYRSETGQIMTDFIPIQIKGEQRMEFAHMLRKGDPVALNGTIAVESYEDSNGNKVFSMFVAAENVNWTQGKQKEGHASEQENTCKQDSSKNQLKKQNEKRTQQHDTNLTVPSPTTQSTQKTGTLDVEMDLDFPELPFA